MKRLFTYKRSSARELAGILGVKRAVVEIDVEFGIVDLTSLVSVLNYILDMRRMQESERVEREVERARKMGRAINFVMN